MEAAASIVSGAKATRRKPLSHNLNGQKLGRKGQLTRERILVATRELLDGPADTQISLSAVARQAGLGMTSLYLYFGDLTELLLSLFEPAMAEAEASFLAELKTRWPDDELPGHCLAFMTRFHAFGAKHARLLRLRDAMATQGDKRMMKQRVGVAERMIDMLAAQMDCPREKMDPATMGMATALYAGFERVVGIVTDSTITTQIDRPFEPRTQHLLAAEARLLEFGIREFRGRA